MRALYFWIEDPLASYETHLALASRAFRPFTKLSSSSCPSLFALRRDSLVTLFYNIFRYVVCWLTLSERMPDTVIQSLPSHRHYPAVFLYTIRWSSSTWYILHSNIGTQVIWQSPRSQPGTQHCCRPGNVNYASPTQWVRFQIKTSRRTFWRPFALVKLILYLWEVHRTQLHLICVIFSMVK